MLELYTRRERETGEWCCVRATIGFHEVTLAKGWGDAVIIPGLSVIGSPCIWDSCYNGKTRSGHVSFFF